VLGRIPAEEHANIFLYEPEVLSALRITHVLKHNDASESGSTTKMSRSKRTVSEPFRFEASLGRLRSLQLGSILAPIEIFLSQTGARSWCGGGETLGQPQKGFFLQDLEVRGALLVSCGRRTSYLNSRPMRGTLPLGKSLE
jgi:hypothetical protein